MLIRSRTSSCYLSTEYVTSNQEVGGARRPRLISGTSRAVARNIIPQETQPVIVVPICAAAQYPTMGPIVPRMPVRQTWTDI